MENEGARSRLLHRDERSSSARRHPDSSSSSGFRLRSPTRSPARSARADFHPPPFSSSPGANSTVSGGHPHPRPQNPHPDTPGAQSPPRPPPLHPQHHVAGIHRAAASPATPAAYMASTSSPAASAPSGAAAAAVPPASHTRISASSSSASTAGYYAPSESLHPARDKAPSGRVYDPTTDTTKERRVSDAWHTAPQSSTPKVSETQSTSFFSPFN